jgi:hypothetical protein
MLVHRLSLNQELILLKTQDFIHMLKYTQYFNTLKTTF